MIILKQMLSMGMCGGVLQHRSAQYTAIPAKWDRHNWDSYGADRQTNSNRPHPERRYGIATNLYGGELKQAPN